MSEFILCGDILVNVSEIRYIYCNDDCFDEMETTDGRFFTLTPGCELRKLSEWYNLKGADC